MMYKFRFVCTVCLLLIFCKPSFAQSPGFDGRRFAVHVPVFNGRYGPLNGLSLEYAMARKTTVRVQLENANYHSRLFLVPWDYLGLDFFKNTYYGYQSETDQYFSNNVQNPISAKVQQVGGSVQFRFYLNRISPAPVGRYYRVGLGYHRVNIHGQFPSSFFLDSIPYETETTLDGSSINMYKNPKIDKTFTAGMVSLYAGFGWQWVLYNRFLINVDGGLSLDYQLASGAEAQAMSALMASGGVAQGFSSRRLTNQPYFHAEDAFETRRFKMGYTGLVGIGYLLF
jgi:hypothetical protein